MIQRPRLLHIVSCGLARLTCALGCFLLVAGFANGQDPSEGDDARSKVEAELQQRINQAISRGVDSLLRQQEIDGSWKNQAPKYPNGQTALSLYTLKKCNVPKDHAAIVRGLQFLRGRQPTRTYSAAIQLLALAALDAEEHKEWIAEVADELESWQRGGFGYPDGEPDLSNTQYAALGLRAAANAGHKVNRRVWERLVKWTLELQQAGETGGFRYHKGYDIVTGSMTSAGIAVLACCREQLPRPGKEVEPGLEQAAAWLGRNFEVERNPERKYVGDEPSDKQGGESYYYVYGLERVGGLLGTSQLGEHDWYREGALWLLQKQADGGNWGGQSDTCFALLFLARATARETFSGPGLSSDSRTYGQDSSNDDVSLRASGRGPLTVWVSSFGKYTTEDYGWEVAPQGTKSGMQRELKVDRVEYRVDDPGADEGSLLLTTIRPKAEGPPHQTQRYPAQLDFDRAGTFEIFARVFLVLPPDVADEEGELREFESRPLQVEIFKTHDPLLELYASDARINQLGKSRFEVRESTKRNDEHAGKAALDGLISTQWMSAADDPKPWLRVDLGRPARGDLLLLTLASDDPGGIVPANRNENNSPALISKLQVTLNDAKTSFTVDVDPNPRRKLEIPLGRLVKVNSIDVRVIEVLPGGRADQGVGLAEIELVFEKDRGRR